MSTLIPGLLFPPVFNSIWDSCLISVPYYHNTPGNTIAGSLSHSRRISPLNKYSCLIQSYLVYLSKWLWLWIVHLHFRCIFESYYELQPTIPRLKDNTNMRVQTISSLSEPDLSHLINPFLPTFLSALPSSTHAQSDNSIKFSGATGQIFKYNNWFPKEHIFYLVGIT